MSFLIFFEAIADMIDYKLVVVIAVVAAVEGVVAKKLKVEKMN